MDIRHILMPTDLSEEAQRPFEPISKLIADLGAKLTIFHVVQDYPITAADAPFAPPISAPTLERDVEAARKTLEDRYGSLDLGFEIECRVVSHTSPTRAIVEFAEQEGVDLIALSTHGRTGFRRFILGSVTEEVLRRSTVPVLSFHRPE